MPTCQHFVKFVYFQIKMPHQNVIVGCRLCLCQDTGRNFFSLAAEEEFSQLKSALGLEANFCQLDLQPNHVCSVCKEVVQQFYKLRLMAMDNEKFLIISQEAVNTYGLEAAKELFENKRNTNTGSQYMLKPDTSIGKYKTDIGEELSNNIEEINKYFTPERIEDNNYISELKHDCTEDDGADVENIWTNNLSNQEKDFKGNNDTNQAEKILEKMVNNQHEGDSVFDETFSEVAMNETENENSKSRLEYFFLPGKKGKGHIHAGRGPGVLVVGGRHRYTYQGWQEVD